MGNREIRPPNGDLGVKAGGREKIIDFLTLGLLFGDRRGGRRGSSGGGGRTKREMQNDMALMEHQFRLQDELERARTARGVEGATQTDANAFANISRFYGGGQMIGVNDAHGNPIITEEELNRRPKRGSGKGSGGTSVSWEDPVYPNQQGGPEVPESTDDPGDTPAPTPRPKKRTAADARLELGALTDKYGSEQGDVSDEEWEDYLGRSSALAEQHDILSRDESRKANNRAKKRAGGGMVADYQPEVIAGGKIKKNTRKTEREAVDYALGETSSLGTVNDNGAIDTGSNGNRPAPGGENGVIEGPQFK